MRKFKKLISVILTVMMIMSVMPVGMVGANGDVSSQSAVSIPAGSIIFEEDFEDYTIDENILTKEGDDWEFISLANDNTTDVAKAIDVSDISVDDKTGFSGKALMIHNEAGTAYNLNNLMYRLNLENAIDLNSNEYAGKKLIVEADVICAPVAGNYAGGDFQSSLMVPTNKTVDDWKDAEFASNYSTGWKILYRKDAVSIQTGDYAGNGTGVKLMAYNHAFSKDKIKDKAGNVRFSYDFSGDADSVSVWVNNKRMTDKLDRKLFTGHVLNDMEMDEFLATNKHGQTNKFGAITGFWGTASDISLYIDNLKIYTIDQFKLVQVTGDTGAFDPITDSLNFEFTNEIDTASIGNCIVELVEEDGDVVTDGITDVSANGKILSVKIAESVLGQTAYTVRIKGSLCDVYGNKLHAEYEWYTYPINDYYTLNNNAGQYQVGSSTYDFTYVPGNGTPDSPAKITAGGTTLPIDCYIRGEAVVEGTLTTCTILEKPVVTLDPTADSIEEYVQGADQKIILTFNDELALSEEELENAFEVTDGNGDVVAGLQPEYGATKNIVELQLSVLTLGRGNHTIKSKPNSLYNEAGTYADFEYSFNTKDFEATTFDTEFEYVPTTEATVIVNLSLETALTNENIETGFVVNPVDSDEVIEGLTATIDGTVITLNLSGLQNLKVGTYTIKTTDKLVIKDGEKIAVLSTPIIFTVPEFKVTNTSSNNFTMKPGDEKEVEIELSVPTKLTEAELYGAFAVEDANGNPVEGLDIALDDTGKVITLYLQGLNIANGDYTIKSNATLVDQADRTLAEVINITFKVAEYDVYFEETFDGFEIGESLLAKTGDAWEFRQTVSNEALDSKDEATIVDVSGITVDGINSFSGKALKLYNDAGTSYQTKNMLYRFNLDEVIDIAALEASGKKLMIEADVIHAPVEEHYTSDYQSSIFVPTVDTVDEFNSSTFNNLYTASWKPFISTNKITVQTGDWTSAGQTAAYMWFNKAHSASTLLNKEANLKFAFNFNSEMDTMSVWVNGDRVTDTLDNKVFDGHALNSVVMDEFVATAGKGKPFNLTGSVTGFWGNVSDAAIYIDNLKVYTVDQFKYVGDTSAIDNFNPSNSVEFTFNNTVAETTNKDCAKLLDKDGNIIKNGIESVTVKDDNKNTIVVRINKNAVSGETEYTIKIDGICDTYGNKLQPTYVWKEYEALESGDVDCYVVTDTTVERKIKTVKMIEVVAEESELVVNSYDLGKAKEVKIVFSDELDPSVNLNEAFVVTDENGAVVTGLSARYGDTTNSVILDLSGLELKYGVHKIASKVDTLESAASKGVYANVTVTVNTIVFEIEADPKPNTILSYVPNTEKIITLYMNYPILGAEDKKDVSEYFGVTDEAGREQTGLKATYYTNDKEGQENKNRDTIEIELEGLALGTGKHTIKTAAGFKDARGLDIVWSYNFTKMSFEVNSISEENIYEYKPGDAKDIEIALSYELSQNTIDNITNAEKIENVFVVTNNTGLRVSGLTASVDKNVIKLHLGTLAISGGKYTIKAVDGAITNTYEEVLSNGITITVNTESESSEGESSGVANGSGEKLPENTDFSNKYLIEKVDFENTDVFNIGAEWYGKSKDRLPAGFNVQIVGTPFVDASVKVINNPKKDATNSSDYVLYSNTGYFGEDGLLNVNDRSSATKYHVITKELDTSVLEGNIIPEDEFTQVRFSTKIYIPKGAERGLPTAITDNLRSSEYLIAAAQVENDKVKQVINDSNFGKNSEGAVIANYPYDEVSNGIKAKWQTKNLSPDVWHTVEIVFSKSEFKDGNTYSSYYMYVDGTPLTDGAFRLERDSNNKALNSFNSMTHMIAQVAGTEGGPVEIYYDDWQVSVETKYATHVDTPSTNVPENQDITLTLTKELDAESVKLIEDSLKDESKENLVTVKDADGNEVEVDITITDGSVIKVEPKNGLKYNTEYVVEVKTATKIDGVEHTLKSVDGEEYKGVSYQFATAKAKDVYIDTENSTITIKDADGNPVVKMEDATKFAYTINLNEDALKDDNGVSTRTYSIIAAVAAFNDKEELIGIEYRTISAGTASEAFEVNTNGRKGTKFVRMYIWEAIQEMDSNGIPRLRRGRLMQSPDEITSK